MIGVTVVVNKEVLDNMPDEIQKGLEDLLDKLGKQIVREARQRAPVLTGALRDSIDYKVDTGELELEVEAKAPYAVFVELGTVSRSGRPFLGPAASLVLGKSTITSLVSDLIDEAAR